MVLIRLRLKVVWVLMEMGSCAPPHWGTSVCCLACLLASLCFDVLRFARLCFAMQCFTRPKSTWCRVGARVPMGIQISSGRSKQRQVEAKRNMSAAEWGPSRSWS